MVDGVSHLSGRQALNDHLLSFLRVAVIHEHALRHRRDPQVLLFVHCHGHHRRILDYTVQITVVAAEFLLIVIVGKESFVVGAEPYVLPGVLEDFCHVGVGHRHREARVALATQRLGEQVHLEKSVLRGAQQDGIVFQETGRLHHAAVIQQPPPDVLV